mgnify:CR=1 FL=1
MQDSFYGDTNIQNQKQQLFARLEAMKETAIQREKENSDLKKFEAYREKVKSTVINLVSSGTAPWLKGHDGNTELSYFPETQYVPQGLRQYGLKSENRNLGQPIRDGTQERMCFPTGIISVITKKRRL